MITSKEFAVFKTAKPPKGIHSIYHAMISRDHLVEVYNLKEAKNVNGNYILCEITLINVNTGFVVKGLLYDNWIDQTQRPRFSGDKTSKLQQVLEHLKTVTINPVIETTNERIETYKKVTIDTKFNKFDQTKWQHKGHDHFGDEIPRSKTQRRGRSSKKVRTDTDNSGSDK